MRTLTLDKASHRVRGSVLFVVWCALLLSPARVSAQDDGSSAIYSQDAIWDFQSHADDVAAMCGVGSWLDLHPDRSVADEGCIVAAMRSLGASDSTVRFFEATGDFLQAFDARGPIIDFGRAASPWVNMGRGEAVLLNGAPSAILISKAFNGRQEEWVGAPGYADLLQRHPNAFPWLEYGGPVSTMTADDGSQLITAVFDMRECRACPNVASMPVVLKFDPGGVLVSADVQPPGQPRQ